jgi:2-amino-4-hydroxy-6-hydroxymethyldihydropteridine diphosphokinase
MMKYYLGLGSNLGNRRRNLARALALLEAAGVRVRKVSSVYRTEPVDFAPQPWFYNLAVAVETALPPGELLNLARRIEEEMGRVRKQKAGPRTIDIDILLAGRQIIRTPRLSVPHPRLDRRNFVLIPMAEISPSAVHPLIRRTVRSLLEASTDKSAVRKLGPLLSGR